MRCLGYEWEQGYGFSGFPDDIGPFRSYQAAYGRLKRANSFLEREDLGAEYYATCETVEKRGNEWWVKNAQIQEIN